MAKRRRKSVRISLEGDKELNKLLSRYGDNSRKVVSPSTKENVKELERIYSQLRRKAEGRLEKLRNDKITRYTPFYKEYRRGFKKLSEISKTGKVNNKGVNKTYVNRLKKQIAKSVEFLNNETSYVRGARRWYKNIVELFDEDLKPNQLKKLFKSYERFQELVGTGDIKNLFADGKISGSNIVLKNLAKVFKENKKLTADELAVKLKNTIDEIYENKQRNLGEALGDDSEEGDFETEDTIYNW